MQIFIRKWSEVSGGRFDPKFLNYTNKIRAKFPITFLNNLLKSNPMYGANEAGISRTSESQPRYIRITDIDDFGCLKDGLGATAQTIQAQYMLEENDILFARSGATVGKTYIHRNIGYESFFAGYMIKFRVDSSKISPYFVFLYTQLDIYKEWVKAIQRASAQPNINAEEYKNLLVPIPPKEIQQQIINIMDNAYLLKAQKENEAKNILDSIDSYILDELGIALPCKNTDLRHRIYTTKLSSISGKRFDCEYYQIYYNELKKSLIEGKYKLEKINQLMDNIRIISKPYEEEIIYIEIGDINVENAIINLKSMKLKDLPNNSKIYIKQGDLLISKVRPNRKAIAIYNEKDRAYCTSAFCVLRENGKYKKELLQYLLRTNILNALIVRNVTGSTYPTINDIDILNLEIPLPPIEIQQKIVDEINERKKKSLNLQKEAKDILEYAKMQVEKIILGEEQ